MEPIRDKLIVLLGPTATGKSELAVELSLKFNGEVISADSRQVYRGMDLGTGKITSAEMRGVPHHLLDISCPKKQFTVAEYQELATKAITEIQSRHKLPILCGGTGQYIRAVTRASELPPVPPNEELRVELETWETEDLVAELKRLDTDRHQSIDRHNRRRLIRAIEIAKALGKVPALKESNSYDSLFIGLTLDGKTLQQKIRERLIKRLDAGLLEEVIQLHNSGISWERLHAFGLEYRYCSEHLQGELSYQKMFAKLETEIWRYAKRQMTYLKKYFPETYWFHPTEREKITSVVAEFLIPTS